MLPSIQATPGIHTQESRKRLQNVPKSILICILLLCLFPYIQLGPLSFDTEVQPWAPLLGWIVITLLLFTGRLQLSRFDRFLIAAGVILALYVPIFSPYFTPAQFLRKSLAFLLLTSIFIVSKYIRASFLISVLKPSIVLWLGFALLEYVSPIFYHTITNAIVPGALGSYGDRGVTSLAPEATDFGFTMVYFGVLGLMASAMAKREGTRQMPLWYYALVFLNLLFSASGSGLFGLVLILGTILVTYDPMTKKPRISIPLLLRGLTVLALCIFLLGILPSSGIRGLDLLQQAIKAPDSLMETTFSYRIAHNVVGFFGSIDSMFLGKGAGTFTSLATSIYFKYNIDVLLGVEGWYKYNIPLSLYTSPLAIFPVILFEYGVIGIAFIAILFRKVLHSPDPLKFVVAMLMFLTWAQSFPVAYPLFWLLMGLSVNYSQEQ